MLISLIMCFFIFYQETNAASANVTEEERQYLRSLRHKKVTVEKEKKETISESKEVPSTVEQNNKITSMTEVKLEDIATEMFMCSIEEVNLIREDDIYETHDQESKNLRFSPTNDKKK